MRRLGRPPHDGSKLGPNPAPRAPLRRHDTYPPSSGELPAEERASRRTHSALGGPVGWRAEGEGYP
eukprot:scaffold4851_cov428-Prasinococcus_capsulatus_cf.AAC.4